MSYPSVIVRSSLLVCAVLSSASLAQQPAPAAPSFSSRPIHVSPITGDEKKEQVLITVSIAPGGAVPMHIHPGDCLGSVVEGTVELLVDGQPPRKASAGDAYSNMRGVVHGFRNIGDGQARLLNSLVADKGVPRTQVVPAPAKP